MSRTLKWFLGILAILSLIAIVAGGVWVWQNRAQMMASVRPYAVQPNVPVTPNAPNAPNLPNGQNGPVGPRGFDGNGRNPMMGRGLRGPMMGGRFFARGMPFGMGLFFLRGLFRLIIPLGLLALVAILFYQLGRRSSPPRQSVAVPREPAPSDAPKSEQDLPKSD